MFGGFGASNPSLGDTWLWDGQDWAQLWFTEPTPPGRSGATLAYDGHRLILFGGLHISSGPTPAGTYLNDTWAFDGAHWQQLHPATSPPARSGAGLLQQGPNGVVIVGGSSETAQVSTYYNDLWQWDGSNWGRLPVSMPGPANRYLFMTAQDTRRGVGLLFGGKSGAGTELNDLWAWDGNAWRALP